MNIDSWLTQTITVAAITGRSASGDPTYGAQVTMGARVEFNVKLNVEGTNIADVHIIVTKTKINLEDRVWLPIDNTAVTTSARRPLSLRNAQTKTGGFTLYETHFAA